MLITVFFPGSKFCRRSFSITESDPDHYSVVSQLVEEIRALEGPLFDRMRKLPPHVVRQVKDFGWSSMIVVEGTTYSALPNGDIVFAFEPKRLLTPGFINDTPDLRSGT